MSRFVGERLEKLPIGWNWAFWVNLSRILGEKMGNVENFEPIQTTLVAKLAMVILSCFGWKWFKKLQFRENWPMYAPPGNENFEIWWKMSYVGRKKLEKLWIRQNWQFKGSLSQLKWTLAVLCYDQNWQKLKYINRIPTAWNLHNRAHFSEPVKMGPRSAMLWSRLTKT